MGTSSEYDALRREVEEEYSSTPRPNDRAYTAAWRKRYGSRWRNRVGIPRLTAETAALRALGLLNSTNLATFRNDPDLAELLIAARQALDEYASALTLDNWDRFSNPPKKKN